MYPLKSKFIAGLVSALFLINSILSPLPIAFADPAPTSDYQPRPGEMTLEEAQQNQNEPEPEPIPQIIEPAGPLSSPTLSEAAVIAGAQLSHFDSPFVKDESSNLSVARISDISQLREIWQRSSVAADEPGDLPPGVHNEPGRSWILVSMPYADAGSRGNVSVSLIDTGLSITVGYTMQGMFAEDNPNYKIIEIDAADPDSIQIQLTHNPPVIWNDDVAPPPSFAPVSDYGAETEAGTVEPWQAPDREPSSSSINEAAFSVCSASTIEMPGPGMPQGGISCGNSFNDLPGGATRTAFLNDLRSAGFKYYGDDTSNPLYAGPSITIPSSYINNPYVNVKNAYHRSVRPSYLGEWYEGDEYNYHYLIALSPSEAIRNQAAGYRQFGETDAIQNLDLNQIQWVIYRNDNPTMLTDLTFGFSELNFSISSEAPPIEVSPEPKESDTPKLPGEPTTLIRDARYFDGIDDREDVPVSPELQGSGNYTFEVRIKPAAPYATLTDWGTLIAKSTREGIFTKLVDGQLKVSFYNQGDFFAPQNLIPGEWIHLAAVNDGSTGTAAYYVNGVKVGTGRAWEPINQGNIYLGLNPDRYEPYAGYIADAKIHNRILSDEEIASMAPVPTSILTPDPDPKPSEEPKKAAETKENNVCYSVGGFPLYGVTPTAFSCSSPSPNNVAGDADKRRQYAQYIAQKYQVEVDPDLITGIQEPPPCMPGEICDADLPTIIWVKTIEVSEVELPDPKPSEEPETPTQKPELYVKCGASRSGKVGNCTSITKEEYMRKMEAAREQERENIKTKLRLNDRLWYGFGGIGIEEPGTYINQQATSHIDTAGFPFEIQLRSWTDGLSADPDELQNTVWGATIPIDNSQSTDTTSLVAEKGIEACEYSYSGAVVCGSFENFKNYSFQLFAGTNNFFTGVSLNDLKEGLYANVANFGLQPGGPDFLNHLGSEKYFLEQMFHENQPQKYYQAFTKGPLADPAFFANRRFYWIDGNELVEISKTQQAEILRSVGAAYQQGLTVGNNHTTVLYLDPANIDPPRVSQPPSVQETAWKHSVLRIQREIPSGTFDTREEAVRVLSNDTSGSTSTNVVILSDTITNIPDDRPFKENWEYHTVHYSYQRQDRWGTSAPIQKTMTFVKYPDGQWGLSEDFTNANQSYPAFLQKGTSILQSQYPGQQIKMVEFEWPRVVSGNFTSEMTFEVCNAQGSCQQKYATGVDRFGLDAQGFPARVYDVTFHEGDLQPDHNAALNLSSAVENSDGPSDQSLLLILIQRAMNENVQSLKRPAPGSYSIRGIELNDGLSTENEKIYDVKFTRTYLWQGDMMIEEDYVAQISSTQLLSEANTGVPPVEELEEHLGELADELLENTVFGGAREQIFGDGTGALQSGETVFSAFGSVNGAGVTAERAEEMLQTLIAAGYKGDFSMALKVVFDSIESAMAFIQNNLRPLGVEAALGFFEGGLSGAAEKITAYLITSLEEHQIRGDESIKNSLYQTKTTIHNHPNENKPSDRDRAAATNLGGEHAVVTLGGKFYLYTGREEDTRELTAEEYKTWLENKIMTGGQVPPSGDSLVIGDPSSTLFADGEVTGMLYYYAPGMSDEHLIKNAVAQAMRSRDWPSELLSFGLFFNPTNIREDISARRTDSRSITTHVWIMEMNGQTVTFEVLRDQEGAASPNIRYSYTPAPVPVVRQIVPDPNQLRTLEDPALLDDMTIIRNSVMNAIAGRRNPEQGGWPAELQPFDPINARHELLGYSLSENIDRRWNLWSMEVNGISVTFAMARNAYGIVEQNILYAYTAASGNGLGNNPVPTPPVITPEPPETSLQGTVLPLPSQLRENLSDPLPSSQELIAAAIAQSTPNILPAGISALNFDSSLLQSSGTSANQNGDFIENYTYPNGTTEILFEVVRSTFTGLATSITFAVVGGVPENNSGGGGTSIVPPVMPAEPTQPVEPEPAQPAEPEPAQPVEPEPAQPVEPEPAQPAEPEPAQPVELEPAQPVEPEPAQPVEPEPAQPVQPQEQNPLPLDSGTTPALRNVTVATNGENVLFTAQVEGTPTFESFSIDNPQVVFSIARGPLTDLRNGAFASDVELVLRPGQVEGNISNTSPPSFRAGDTLYYSVTLVQQGWQTAPIYGSFVVGGAPESNPGSTEGTPIVPVMPAEPAQPVELELPPQETHNYQWSQTVRPVRVRSMEELMVDINLLGNESGTNVSVDFAGGFRPGDILEALIAPDGINFEAARYAIPCTLAPGGYQCRGQVPSVPQGGTIMLARNGAAWYGHVVLPSDFDVTWNLERDTTYGNRRANAVNSVSPDVPGLPGSPDTYYEIGTVFNSDESTNFSHFPASNPFSSLQVGNAALTPMPDGRTAFSIQITGLTPPEGTNAAVYLTYRLAGMSEVFRVETPCNEQGVCTGIFNNPPPGSYAMATEIFYYRAVSDTVSSNNDDLTDTLPATRVSFINPGGLKDITLAGRAEGTYGIAPSYVPVAEMEGVPAHFSHIMPAALIRQGSWGNGEINITNTIDMYAVHFSQNGPGFEGLFGFVNQQMTTDRLGNNPETEIFRVNPPVLGKLEEMDPYEYHQIRPVLPDGSTPYVSVGTQTNRSYVVNSLRMALYYTLGLMQKNGVPLPGGQQMGMTGPTADVVMAGISWNFDDWITYQRMPSTLEGYEVFDVPVQLLKLDRTPMNVTLPVAARTIGNYLELRIIGENDGPPSATPWVPEISEPEPVPVPVPEVLPETEPLPTPNPYETPLPSSEPGTSLLPLPEELQSNLFSEQSSEEALSTPAPAETDPPEQIPSPSALPGEWRGAASMFIPPGIYYTVGTTVHYDQPTTIVLAEPWEPIQIQEINYEALEDGRTRFSIHITSGLEPPPGEMTTVNLVYTGSQTNWPVTVQTPCDAEGRCSGVFDAPPGEYGINLQLFHWAIAGHEESASSSSAVPATPPSIEQLAGMLDSSVSEDFRQNTAFGGTTETLFGDGTVTNSGAGVMAELSGLPPGKGVTSEKALSILQQLIAAGVNGNFSMALKIVFDSIDTLFEFIQNKLRTLGFEAVLGIEKSGPAAIGEKVSAWLITSFEEHQIRGDETMKGILAKTVTTIHNHPNENRPSRDDIAMAKILGGPHGVVTRGGKYYIYDGDGNVQELTASEYWQQLRGRIFPFAEPKLPAEIEYMTCAVNASNVIKGCSSIPEPPFEFGFDPAYFEANLDRYGTFTLSGGVMAGAEGIPQDPANWKYIKETFPRADGSYSIYLAKIKTPSPLNPTITSNVSETLFSDGKESPVSSETQPEDIETSPNSSVAEMPWIACPYFNNTVDLTACMPFSAEGANEAAVENFDAATQDMGMGNPLWQAGDNNIEGAPQGVMIRAWSPDPMDGSNGHVIIGPEEVSTPEQVEDPATTAETQYTCYGVGGQAGLITGPQEMQCPTSEQIENDYRIIFFEGQPTTWSADSLAGRPQFYADWINNIDPSRNVSADDIVGELSYCPKNMISCQDSGGIVFVKKQPSPNSAPGNEGPAGTKTPEAPVENSPLETELTPVFMLAIATDHIEGNDFTTSIKRAGSNAWTEPINIPASLFSAIVEGAAANVITRVTNPEELAMLAARGLTGNEIYRRLEPKHSLLFNHSEQFTYFIGTNNAPAEGNPNQGSQEQTPETSVKCFTADGGLAGSQQITCAKNSPNNAAAILAGTHPRISPEILQSLASAAGVPIGSITGGESSCPDDPGVMCGDSVYTVWVNEGAVEPKISPSSTLSPAALTAINLSEGIPITASVRDPLLVHTGTNDVAFFPAAGDGSDWWDRYASWSVLNGDDDPDGMEHGENAIAYHSFNIQLNGQKLQVLMSGDTATFTLFPAPGSTPAPTIDQNTPSNLYYPYPVEAEAEPEPEPQEQVEGPTEKNICYSIGGLMAGNKTQMTCPTSDSPNNLLTCTESSCAATREAIGELLGVDPDRVTGSQYGCGGLEKDCPTIYWISDEEGSPAAQTQPEGAQVAEFDFYDCGGLISSSSCHKISSNELSSHLNLSLINLSQAYNQGRAFSDITASITFNGGDELPSDAKEILPFDFGAFGIWRSIFAAKKESQPEPKQTWGTSLDFPLPPSSGPASEPDVQEEIDSSIEPEDESAAETREEENQNEQLPEEVICSFQASNPSSVSCHEHIDDELDLVGPLSMVSENVKSDISSRYGIPAEQFTGFSSDAYVVDCAVPGCETIRFTYKPTAENPGPWQQEEIGLLSVPFQRLKHFSDTNNEDNNGAAMQGIFTDPNGWLEFQQQVVTSFSLDPATGTLIHNFAPEVDFETNAVIYVRDRTLSHGGSNIQITSVEQLITDDNGNSLIRVGVKYGYPTLGGYPSLGYVQDVLSRSMDAITIPVSYLQDGALIEFFNTDTGKVIGSGIEIEPKEAATPSKEQIAGKLDAETAKAFREYAVVGGTTETLFGDGSVTAQSAGVTAAASGVSAGEGMTSEKALSIVKQLTEAGYEGQVSIALKVVFDSIDKVMEFIQNNLRKLGVEAVLGFMASNFIGAGQKVFTWFVTSLEKHQIRGDEGSKALLATTTTTIHNHPGPDDDKPSPDDLKFGTFHGGTHAVVTPNKIYMYDSVPESVREVRPEYYKSEIEKAIFPVGSPKTSTPIEYKMCVVDGNHHMKGCMPIASAPWEFGFDPVHFEANLSKYGTFSLSHNAGIVAGAPGVPPDPANWKYIKETAPRADGSYTFYLAKISSLTQAGPSLIQNPSQTLFSDGGTTPATESMAALPDNFVNAAGAASAALFGDGEAPRASREVVRTTDREVRTSTRSGNREEARNVELVNRPERREAENNVSRPAVRELSESERASLRTTMRAFSTTTDPAQRFQMIRDMNDPQQLNQILRGLSAAEIEALLNEAAAAGSNNAALLQVLQNVEEQRFQREQRSTELRERRAEINRQRMIERLRRQAERNGSRGPTRLVARGEGESRRSSESQP